jgi:hypothetical protein
MGDGADECLKRAEREERIGVQDVPRRESTNGAFVFLINGEYVNINTSVDIFAAINKLLRDRNETQNSHIEKITINDPLNPPNFPYTLLHTTVGVSVPLGNVSVINHDLLTDKEKKKLEKLIWSIHQRAVEEETECRKHRT